MTDRFFVAEDHNDLLARIDIDPTVWRAQRLDATGWHDVESLFRIVLTDDNLEWEEVSHKRAKQIGRRVSPGTVV